jgi:hypothetical protein
MLRIKPEEKPKELEDQENKKQDVYSIDFKDQCKRQIFQIQEPSLTIGRLF